MDFPVVYYLNPKNIRGFGDIAGLAIEQRKDGTPFVRVSSDADRQRLIQVSEERGVSITILNARTTPHSGVSPYDSMI